MFHRQLIPDELRVSRAITEVLATERGHETTDNRGMFGIELRKLDQRVPVLETVAKGILTLILRWR
jgi:hypothetical protein